MKKLILIALAVCATRLASAAEVTAAQAQAAVDAWLQDDAALGCALGRAAESTRTCTATNGAPFHVVKLAGGGFVVTSADTTVEPIIAFSDDDDLIESEENPLWVLLRTDLALRTADIVAARGTKGLLKASATRSGSSTNEAKWNRLLGKTRLLRASQGQGVSSVSDVRVAPLVQSKWNQGAVGDDPCYNYYTPNHYICGCVATAGAQIMRYFEWPRSDVSVAQFANTHCAVDGATRTLTMQGGYYDWSQMPLALDGSITETQRQAIGKLTSDIGICVGMKYNPKASSSSGFMLAEAFTNRYGYANALAAQWQSDVSGREDVKNALLSNLDAGLPVAVSLSGAGGHEIVGDGYGYSGNTLYLHFNMGWSGLDDAWYAPPNMAGSQYNFNVLNGFVCNVFTNSADKGGVICSGRVLDETGAPIEGATVSAKKSGWASATKSTVTNAKGIYSFVFTGLSSHAMSYYTLTATFGDSSASTNVSLKANVGSNIVTSGSDFGSYYLTPAPSIGNKWGQDIAITGVAGVDEPQFDPASCLFYPSTNVTITCATEGATIRYTLDGTDPTEASPVYTNPIFIDDDTEIRARAWKSGMNPSAVVAEIYTYDAAQGAPKGDYFADPIVISGESGSRVIDDNTSYTVESGEPLHTLEDYRYYDQYYTVWYKWTALGSGTMSFTTELQWWSGTAAIAAYTGGDITSLSRLDYSVDYDQTGSASITINVEQGNTYHIVGFVLWDDTTGQFTLTWSGDLTVAPTEPTETESTDVPVPHSWLETYLPELSGGSDAAAYEAAAVADSDGDGFANWQEFLLGTDPTNETSRFFATIDFVNGQPVFGWSVTNASLEELGYKYSPKGTTSLALPNWEDWNGHPFFKVVIEPINNP